MRDCWCVDKCKNTNGGSEIHILTYVAGNFYTVRIGGVVGRLVQRVSLRNLYRLPIYVSRPFRGRTPSERHVISVAVLLPRRITRP